MSMKKIFRDAIYGKNKKPTQVTPSSELRRFLAMTRPVTTTHPLIRIGATADGGYLVPDDLTGIKACFSPGVGPVADFELGLAERGIDCFLADFSVDGPPVDHPRMHFEKKHVGISNSDSQLTLEDWVRTNAPADGDLLLQMDIEGAEFDVIFDTSNELLRRFRIMVVEFHRMDRLTESNSLEFISAGFAKLCKNFHVVHIHTNNSIPPVRIGELEVPPVMEFTFLRKERAATVTPTLSFPHPLDRVNLPELPDFALPVCWYEQ